ncbi:hypothetical protein ACFPJ1_40595 [Kribbella qitaiheensis]|uniref:hypothetical protein n=1 Tax=Kribbella qitaiheensis TaxID=1544730 RepID=UPI0036145E2B
MSDRIGSASTGTQTPLNGTEALSSDEWRQVRAERPTTDPRSAAAHVAVPPSECLNGCQQGTGDARGPVLCQPGQYLCSDDTDKRRSCLTKLDGWLRDLPTLFGLLLWVKGHGTVPGNPENARTKQPDAPAPMRLEVVDLLDQRPGFGALALLHGWAELVREQRNQPRHCTCGHLALGHQPNSVVACTAKTCRCHAYQPIAPTVAAECKMILANLAYCTEQAWAGDLYTELKDLNRQLADTVGDYRARPVGKCAKLTDKPGVPVQVLCGGALVMDREGHGVTCLTCGTHHRADEGLRELGLIVGSLFRDDGTTTGIRKAAS